MIGHEMWIEFVSTLEELEIGASSEVSQEEFLSAFTTLPTSLPSLDRHALMTGNNLINLIKLSSLYQNSVDFIYIDPPYNTGSKFIYQDKRKGGKNTLLGSHSSWASFMVQRLFFAQKLLKKNGLIAISIDDYEQAYLKILLDAVFGEENFIGTIIVARSKNGNGGRKNNFAVNHEYLHVYGKSKISTLRGTVDDSENYNLSDIHGRYRLDGLFRKKGDASLRTDRPNMYYPLYYDGTTGEVFIEPSEGLLEVYPVDSKGTERRWLWGKETAQKNRWKLFASPSGVIYVKNYFNEEKRLKIRSLWGYDSAFYTEQATKEIKHIYGDKVFETPKPLRYIEHIIDTMSPTDGIVLDFFAGTGTTAHAVEKLNQEKKSNRTVWLMESSDLVPEGHTAQEKGFKLISDITKYRLKYIQAELSDVEFEIFPG